MPLNKYVRFVTRAKRSVAYWTRVAMRDFTDDLLSRMSSRGISNSGLATAIDVSPAYITKVLRGSENFTLETMTKLALAVGCKVRIHVAAIADETLWIDLPTTATTTVVQKPDHQTVDGRIKVGFIGSEGSMVFAKAA